MNISKELIDKQCHRKSLICSNISIQDSFIGKLLYDNINNNINIEYKPKDTFTKDDLIRLVESVKTIEVNCNPHIWTIRGDNND